jgi:hypothetical protein
MTRAVKVMVTMLVNGSLKNIKVESMITHPYKLKLDGHRKITWKIDFQTHRRKVFVERERPFCKV